MKKNTWKKSIICGFIVSVLCSFINFSGYCEDISNKVLRLHIIANSDSFEDQNLKLKVRDRILRDFKFETSGIKTVNEAEIFAEENIDTIKSIAQDEVFNNGFDYPVNAELVNMYFNTRIYTDVTLPAGNYDALRITIGEARGKNWWCVMFPPMCIPSAEKKIEINEVLNEPEIKIVTNFGDYQVEFKIVEVFFKARNFFECNIYAPVKNYLFNKDNFKYDIGFSFKK